MLESIILGTIQGIAEWLPISSEAMIVLVKTNFFGGVNFQETLRLALFLHFGTFLAALVYFWADVKKIVKNIFNYKNALPEEKSVLRFLTITTIISGILGLIILKLISGLEGEIEFSGKVITVFVGLLLLITAFLQLKHKQENFKKEINLTNKDSWLLGIVQGLASLPGLSRSGTTVSVLLLRKFEEGLSLKLSFLMSLPIVLGGNIFLNWSYFNLSLQNLVGLLFSFGFGYLTIHLLLGLTKKINFGWFVLVFGLLMIAAAFI